MSPDPTPLAILLTIMRQKWSEGDHVAAIAIAKITAPYVHPRRVMNTSHPNAPTELHRLTDEELAIRLMEARRRAEDP